MADKDEFSFEEEQELRDGDEDSGAFTEQHLRESLSASALKQQKKGSPKRLLLLVLLLVVIGAAGWFLFPGEPEAPSPLPPVVAEKQPIAVPAPPTPAKEEMPAVPAPPQAQEAPVEKPVAEEVMPKENPAPAPVVSSPPVEEARAMAAPTGAYTVEAGAFLLKANLAEAEKKVREIGFEPRVVQKEKSVTMTRLRVGVFSTEEGKNKVEELVTLAPDAFYVRQGEEVAVYAASFHDLDTARRFADRLYGQGIRVVEEPVQAGLPLFLLSFGDFADLPEARQASAKARAAGLEVFVAKNR
jgi:hypothetical protein